jgi:hypothetical protein
MVGGTFGVAAIGALFQSLLKSRLTTDLSGLHLSAAQHGRIADAIGSGQGPHALKGLDPSTAQQAGRAMKDAFVHGLSGGLKLSTAVAAAGAVLAFTLIEPHVKTRRAGAHAEGHAAEPTAPVAEPEAA